MSVQYDECYITLRLGLHGSFFAWYTVGENQNHVITCEPLEDCSVESVEDDVNSYQPKISFLLEVS